MKPAYSAESFQFINILIQHDAISVKDQRFLEVFRNTQKAASANINMYQEVWEDLSPDIRLDESKVGKARIFSDGDKDALEKRHFEDETTHPKLMTYKSCPTGVYDEIMI